jgi:hypothetical protein
MIVSRELNQRNSLLLVFSWYTSELSVKSDMGRIQQVFLHLEKAIVNFIYPYDFSLLYSKLFQSEVWFRLFMLGPMCFLALDFCNYDLATIESI